MSPVPGGALVPGGPARAEITVVNSRFIASLDYADSVAAARDFIARMKAEFPDATHNVPAFIAGTGNSRTEFCSDDGEPAGTSGRPLLAVLRGSGMGNVVVVVTRYFGGTLLGTGGLVKAYSEAGKRVLDRTTQAHMVELTRVRLVLPYSCFDAFRLGLSGFGAAMLREEFTDAVMVEVELPSGNCGIFQTRVADLSSGTARWELLGCATGRQALPAQDSAAPAR
jgi:uncharacterized YigZ family protein